MTIELNVFSEDILDRDEVEYLSTSYGNKSYTVYIETNHRLTQEETDTFVIPLLKSVRYSTEFIYRVREDDFNIIYEMATFREDNKGFLCNVVIFCPYSC